MVDIVHRKTICLNMIVKNESHIIASTLKNILEHVKIDSWVISDTGSTDDTVDIIQHFFKERGISGEIFHDKWKDFGHNRTKALEHAYDKSDYLFIFDADDLIHGDMQLPSTLDKDTYDLQFGNPVSYHRSILISNRMKWKYVGVLHELLHNVDPIKSRGYLLGNYNIESRRLGDRSKNPNKYVDDALVLEKGFEEENTDLWLKYRYAYYCGQSYNDAGKWEKAIEWYERTLTLDYSPQYKYCACIKAGDCYNVLKQYSNAIDSWSKAYFYDKERLEGIVKIMEYFYNKKQHFMVSSLYNKFKHVKIGNAKDKIFLDYSKYHDFHYFASVSGCYCDEYKSAYEACKYMLLNNRPNSANTIYNLKFYMKHFKEDDDNKSLLDYFVTYIMNPQIVFKERKNAWNIVNSIIKEQLLDKYEILENIITTPQKKNIDKNSKYASSKNILIYTGWMTHLWNESHLDKKALGGSEKAVAYLSRELPKGYNIIISGYVEEGTFANRTYVHQSKLQSILDNTIFHTIIVSRNINFLTEFNNLKCFQLILSLHDTHILTPDNNANHVLDMHNTSIDKVVTLTPWHKSNISKIHPSIPNNKIEIINNGIDISQFPNTKEIDGESIQKIRNKFIWSSRTERGLHIVLNLWGEILEKIPDATLDICSYGKFPKDPADQKMLDIINSYDSITYHGKLSAIELYELMSISEYWLYTSTFPETSCITAMEMLMSGVICLYYPLAGLVDTVGDYGIQVKLGNEIETIMNLSEETKAELIKNGKEYALTCSWTNRAVQWTNMLGLDIKNNRIGIFNSFPFHYEMFGFILNYAKNNEILVDIFTNTQNDLGWIDFYREKFNNFNVIDFKKFEGNTNNYSTFFVTTDDDPLFKTEWIDNNVVCLNHYYKIRSPNFKHYLNVANFKDSPLEYSYPCYPLINYKEKKQNTTVCVIGGGNIHTNHNIDIINRLESKNKIILNIFVRKICNTNISGVDTSKFNINFIEDIETQEMIKILKQSSYILINYNSNEDHNNGISCSGSLQLALSTLCKPIMVNTSNKYLQIENALEFDIASDEQINIDGEIDFKAIEEERNKYVDKFEYYLNNIKQSYNFEHDEVNISLLDNIKDYKSIYQNYMDRGNTEIMFRKLITHIFPYFKDKNIIDLGAYIGDNSVPWALKSNGIIYAIDPSKENTDFIDKMAKHNKLDNIVTITKAISDKSETIYYNENDDTHISCNTNTGRGSFQATNLDNLNLENIGFIHLDVEGFEYKVLQGSINIINKYNPIIVWENHIEKEDYMKIVNFFSSHNYNTFLINEQFPHCFPDCRNFISLPENSNININNINKKFQEIYKDFTPDKNRHFLVKQGDSNNIQSTIYLRILSDPFSSNNMENWMETDKLSYMYNKPVILTKKDNYTHCIIINVGMPKLNINKNKVVGISHEPTLPEEPLRSQVIEYAKKNMQKYFIGDKNNLPEPFIEGQTFMFHNKTRYHNIPKTKFCSIVISKKQCTSGHKYRHKLVEAILKTDLPIDIYGYGVEIYKNKMNDHRLKYHLPNTKLNPCGIDPFIDYKFHICIENMVSNNYFSEKIVNPLLSNIIPIYYGCKKIDNYFDNIIKLTGNIEQDINLLKKIFEKQHMYINTYNSDKILDKCNMFYNLHTFFDDIKLKDEIIIPKKLFQTWEHSNIEPDFQEIIDIWKNNNLDYEYIFHDSGQRLKFIEENFEENVVNAYNKIIPGAYKCDLWRYCVLYIYGGFYADIDTLCMGK